MDWEKIATNFGLPGFMIVVFGYVAITLGKLWIPSNEKIQLEKVKVEDKKAEAMASALTSLSGKVDSHHTADIQSHQELGEGIAAIQATLTERHNTPVEGVPMHSGYYGPRPKTSPGGR